MNSLLWSGSLNIEVTKLSLCFFVPNYQVFLRYIHIFCQNIIDIAVRAGRFNGRVCVCGYCNRFSSFWKGTSVSIKRTSMALICLIETLVHSPKTCGSKTIWIFSGERGKKLSYLPIFDITNPVILYHKLLF